MGKISQGYWWGLGVWLIDAGLQVSGYSNIYLGLALGIVGFIFCLIPSIKYVISNCDLSIVGLRPSSLISLQNAVIKALDELYETPFYWENLGNSFLEYGSNDERVRNAFAKGIARQCKLYGNDSPEAKKVFLVQGDLVRAIGQGGSVLIDKYGLPFKYNLKVDRRQFNDLLKKEKINVTR